MVVIVDNSYLVPLFLADEDSAPVEKLLREACSEGYSLLVPSLWLTEFGNTMLICMRRNRLTAEEHKIALEQATKMPLTVQSYPSLRELEKISELASAHDLSFYDATYLALALEKGGELATLDRKLSNAAQAEGVLYSAF